MLGKEFDSRIKTIFSGIKLTYIASICERSSFYIVDSDMIQRFDSDMIQQFCWPHLDPDPERFAPSIPPSEILDVIHISLQVSYKEDGGVSKCHYLSQRSL